MPFCKTLWHCYLSLNVRSPVEVLIINAGISYKLYEGISRVSDFQLLVKSTDFIDIDTNKYINSFSVIYSIGYTLVAQCHPSNAILGIVLTLWTIQDLCELLIVSDASRMQ